MQDIFKEIAQHLKQRASNPLMGAIAVSWLVWNHRVVIALLTIRPTESAFYYIDNSLYGSLCQHLLYYYLGPVISGLVFVYAIPYLTRHATEYSYRVKQDERRMQKKVEGQTLLTLDESRQVQRELERVSSLLLQRETELESALKQLASRQEPKRDIWSELTEGQKSILYDLSSVEEGNYVTLGSLRSVHNVSQLDIMTDIDVLLDLGLIHRFGEGKYQGNSKGRRIIPVEYSRRQLSVEQLESGETSDTQDTEP